MPFSREDRRVQNSKQDKVVFLKSPPSSTSMINGTQAIAILPNKQLGYYIKQKGSLWSSYFTNDGNQIVDKNLKIRQNLTVDNNLIVKKDLIVDGEIKGQRSILQFGENTQRSADAYLKTVNGVQMASGVGFVMHRPGSIVGISILTDIDTVDGGDSPLTFEVRKNTSATVLFSTEFVGGSTGLRTSYSSQNRGVDTFVAGDILIVYANESGTWIWDYVIGHVEVIFDS